MAEKDNQYDQNRESDKTGLINIQGDKSEQGIIIWGQSGDSKIFVLFQ